jgi:hypothetical protein
VTRNLKQAGRSAVALAIGLASLGAWGQSPRPVPRPRSPVDSLPLWRGYDSTHPAPAQKYVFFDTDSAEYVVYFPERLKTGAADDGRVLGFRFQPQFVVEPDIRVAVHSQGEGYVYEYAVTNSASARAPIRNFILVLSPNDASARLEHPTCHPSPTQAGRAPFAPQAALFEGAELRDPSHMGIFAYWSCGSTAEPITPGATLGKFRVFSTFLPGITTAYASTGNALRTPFELPPEVMDQIVPLLVPENSFKAAATIAPKYRSDGPEAATPRLIAQDYQQALTQLTKDRRVSSESAFVDEVRALLNTVVGTDKRTPIQFRSSPGSNLEKEIGAALQLALGSKRD